MATVLGRFDAAIKLHRRAIELDPLNRGAHEFLAWDLVVAGQLEEAAATFRHLLDLDPQYPASHFGMGFIYLLQNQPQLALSEMQQETDPATRELGMVLALSALGRNAEADQVLAAFIEEYHESAAFSIAGVYAWHGEVDQAFMWLDTAYEQRDGYLAGILSDPMLASLKSDPRWPAFLDKMGLPH